MVNCSKALCIVASSRIADLTARALYENIKKAKKPNGEGKGGTYFGATGSGKSFTMLYLTRLLMKSEH
jgi:type I restriction enzyme R subunit